MLNMKLTYSGRRTTEDDDLKILKVEYLSNRWLDLLQILKSIMVEMKTPYNGRRPTEEDNLKLTYFKPKI